MLKAVDGGDLSSLRAVEEELELLNERGAAQNVKAMRQVMAQAQPYLAASRFEPFEKQRAGARDFFGRSGSQPQGQLESGTEPGPAKAPPASGQGREPGAANASPASGQGREPGEANTPPASGQGREPATAQAKSQALSIVERGIAERENRFRRDPAGYVAGHPLLGREGLSVEEFCKEEGITLEQHIDRSLYLQTQMLGGKGMIRLDGRAGLSQPGLEINSNLRALTQARAVQVKDEYENIKDPREKAEYLRKLTVEGGKYAPRILAEAGLPMGVTAFSQLLPEFSASETAKLAQSCGMFLDSMDLPDSRKTEIREDVSDSLLAQALLAADAAMSGSSRPGFVVKAAIRTLETFAALGGNMADLERRITLANAQIVKGMLADAASNAAKEAQAVNLNKPASSSQQTPGKEPNATGAPVWNYDEARQDYNGLETDRDRAIYLQEAVKDHGENASGIARAAGLQPGLAMFAETFAGLSPKSIELLLKAANAPENLGLGQLDLDSFTQIAAESQTGMMIAAAANQARQSIDSSPMLSEIMNSEPSEYESEEDARFREGLKTTYNASHDAMRILGLYIYLGGDIRELDKASGQSKVLGEAGESTWEALGKHMRILGSGLRGEVDGVLDGLDFACFPARWYLNTIAEALGYGKDAIKPMAGTVTGFMISPETPEEKWAYGLNREFGSRIAITGAGGLAVGAAGFGGSAFASAFQATTQGLVFDVGSFAAEQASRELGLPYWAQWVVGMGAGMLSVDVFENAAKGGQRLMSDLTLDPVPGAGRTRLTGGGYSASPSAPGRSWQGAVARAEERAAEAEARAGAAKAGEIESSVPNQKMTEGGTRPKSGPDFADYRTHEEMMASRKHIEAIEVSAEDYLYTPKDDVAISKTKTQKRARNLERDLGVTTELEETPSGKWAIRVESVPEPPSLEELTKSLGDAYDAAMRGEKTGKIHLGVVGPEEAARIKKETGVDVLLCKREADLSWLGHTDERHGIEKLTGQLDVAKEDVERLAKVVREPHVISEGKRYPNSVVYEHRFPDGTIYAVEQQKHGIKLEFRTMWKQEAGSTTKVVIFALPLAAEKLDEDN